MRLIDVDQFDATAFMSASEVFSVIKLRLNAKHTFVALRPSVLRLAI